MDRRRLLVSALTLAAAPAIARAESGEKKKKSGGVSFIQMETVTATLIRADGRHGVLTVETGLDVPDPALHTKALQLLPRIRAAYVQSVQIYASGLPAATAPNADYIARELQRQTDLIMGGSGAKLLLGTILVN